MSRERGGWKGAGIAALLVMLGVPSAWASTEGTSRVEGVAALLRHNQAAARTRALQDAFRKALEQVVAALLEPEMLVRQRQFLETRLYAQSPKYIQSYRVLWEYPDVEQKVFRVGIEAEVNVVEVAEALSVLGVTAPVATGQGLVLAMADRFRGEDQSGRLGELDGVVARALRGHLLSAGFHVIERALEVGSADQETTVLMAGREVGSKVVLVGQAEVQRVRNEVAGTLVQAVQASAQIRAVLTATGEQLAAERVETTGFHADALLAGRQALEKAAAELATRLVPSLRTYFQ